MPLAIGLEPAQSFEKFLPGDNAAPIAHLKALAPGAPPVYLWGPAGSGKTHLLHAGLERAGGPARWFSAAAPPHRLASDEDAAWLVFDEVDAYDAAAQQAAFALFVDAGSRGAVVLAAGRVPPVDLPVREDLRTRLAQGHVFALAPLAESGVRAALRREADRRGTVLSDEVLDYLLTRFARDLKHLMARLDALDAFSMSTRRAITVPLLKQMLAEESAA